MQDILGLVGQLRRPRLLVQAARLGIDDYNRDQCLPRLLRGAGMVRSGEAAMLLLDLESACEEQRVARAAKYSVARHVEVLIALMGEARIVRAGHRPAA